MSAPLHEIDKLFRDGIEGRSEYPPKDVWDNIESELDKETVINSYRRKYNSLKRKTSILLALFLAVIVYGTIKLDKEKNPVEPGHDTAAQLQPGNADHSRQVVNMEKPVQHTNVVLEKRGDIKAGQLPVVSGDRDEEIKDKENSFANTEPGKETGNISLAAVSSARDKSETKYPEEGMKRLSSLKMMTLDDSWKKGVTNIPGPAIINPVPLSASHSVIKKPREGRSRFSLAFQFSAMSNWNTIKENEEYDRWRRGRGGNGNGNGNGGNGTGNGNTTNGNGNSNGNNGNLIVVNGNGNWGGTNSSGGNWGGHHNDRHDLKNSEYSQVAYAGGIILGYNISKRLSLQTGLSYQLNSSKIKNKIIYADKDSSGKLGYLLNFSAGYTTFSPPDGTTPRVRDSITVSDTRNLSSYLGIPLTVEYRILSAGKFSLSASAGGQANLLLRGKTKAVLGKGTVNETRETDNTEGLKPAYFSALAGITGEMQINKNISVTIAPAGQFGLANVNTKRSIKTRTNYLGLTAGLKLSL